MDSAQPAEIIDFNAEWLHRRILCHMNANEWPEAELASAMLEGYLDGIWTRVRWSKGEPVFELSKSAQLDLPGLTEGLYEGPLYEQ